MGETLSVDTLTAYLKRKFPKANAERILGPESEYDDIRKVKKLIFNFVLMFFSVFFCFCGSEDYNLITA